MSCRIWPPQNASPRFSVPGFFQMSRPPAMAEKDRDRSLAQTEAVLGRMVDRGCLSEVDRDFIIRAARNAGDPEHALGFAALPPHIDPGNSKDLPIREIIDTLIEQGRPFFLGWPRDRWCRKRRQLQRLREFTPPPPRYERVGWLARCLPSDRRLRILDTPNRLLRESLRQGLPLSELDPQLQCGRLGGISVLADKKRWTVVLHAPSGFRRPRVHSVHGTNGVAPDERARAAIADALGKGIDMTRPSRRAWQAVGRVTIGGLGAALLLAVAPIERPAPEFLPAAGVAAAGVGCYAIRQVLSEMTGGRGSGRNPCSGSDHPGAFPHRKTGRAPAIVATGRLPHGSACLATHRQMVLIGVEY